MNGRGPGRPQGTTHDEIRDAALGLFLDRGYARTSLAQIAAAVGISRTTLFAYFPAKRDLVWEEFDRRAAGVEDVFAQATADRPLVDVITEAMLVNSRYTPAEHTAFAQRMRIVAQDEELRAYTALAVQHLTRRLAESASRRCPEADPALVDMVTRALVAAAARCTEEWAADPPSTSLDAYTAERLQPVIAALRPLLP